MTDVEAFPSALQTLPEAARAAALEALEKEFARAPGEAPPLPEAERDLGHAYVLAGLFKGRYIWAKHMGKWLEYDSGAWRPVHDERVEYAAAEALRREYARLLDAETDRERIKELTKRINDACVAARVYGALRFLRGMTGFYAESFDQDPWLLNCRNGTLNLFTMQLQPHNPDDLLTKQAPVDYDPDADCPGWQAHLERCIPSPAVRRQIARDLGLSLVGAALDEILPVWWGDGKNGKTTTTRVLMGVLGDYAGRAAPNLLIASKYERHPTELADLAGKRLVISIETGEGKRLNEALVKELTGGDTLKGRFMRQDFFSFPKTFTIFLITNHKPVIRGVDSGIWRRIRLVPWTVEIPPDVRRPQDEVVAELLTEGPGILNWLLDGFLDWFASRDWVAPEVQAATEAYRAEQDVLGAFIAEACELGDRHSVPVAELYEAYVAWCGQAGEEALGKAAFGRILRQRGIDQERTMTERKWRGIRLKRL